MNQEAAGKGPVYGTVMQRECPHDIGIQTWRFVDGKSAGMWSCTQCARKFVPLDLAMEKDAKRYRYLRNRKPDDVLLCNGPAAGCWIDTEETGDPGKPYLLTLLTGDDADAAIDAAMERQKAVSDA